jgi:hypothetical protein
VDEDGPVVVAACATRGLGRADWVARIGSRGLGRADWVARIGSRGLGRRGLGRRGLGRRARSRAEWFNPTGRLGAPLTEIICTPPGLELAAVSLFSLPSQELGIHLRHPFGRRRLAVKRKTQGRKTLEKVGPLITPDTILRWHRTIVAKKWDYGQRR